MKDWNRIRNLIRFFFTPSAVSDFREIFSRELAGRPDSYLLAELTATAATARHHHTKPNGAQVWRAGRPWRHYLLVGRPRRQGDDPPVMAVGPPSNAHQLPPTRATLLPGESYYWWRYEDGDTLAEGVPEDVEPQNEPGAARPGAHPDVVALVAEAERRGLEPAQVAKRLSIQPATWKKWRAGTSRPNLERVRALLQEWGALSSNIRAEPAPLRRTAANPEAAPALRREETPAGHRLTPDTVAEIKRRLQAHEPQAAIARDVGTTRATVAHYARQLGLAPRAGRPPVEEPADQVLRVHLTESQLAAVNDRGGPRWVRELIAQHLGNNSGPP